jgi:hypothetical protein
VFGVCVCEGGGEGGVLAPTTQVWSSGQVAGQSGKVLIRLMQR